MLGMGFINICLIIVVCSLPLKHNFIDIKGRIYKSADFYFPFDENVKILVKSFSSLYSGIEFFDSVKNNLNIDGLLGVRIVSDQLNVTLGILYKYYETEKPWIRDVMTTLVDLQQQAEDLFEKALPQVILNDSKYFKGIGKILGKGTWAHLPNSFLFVDKIYEYERTLTLDEIPMNESISDQCVSELLRDCNISWNCWKIMTDIEYQDYQLSHQIFYLEIGKMAKCESKMDYFVKKSNQNSLSGLLSLFCTNMLKEAQKIADKFFPLNDIDLFMENIAFCGILGFNEFTENKEWIKRIINWQNIIGCYLKSADNDRKKRREKVLDNGCSTHKTSMALASTVVNIRNIILDLMAYTFGVKI